MPVPAFVEFRRNLTDLGVRELGRRSTVGGIRLSPGSAPLTHGDGLFGGNAPCLRQKSVPCSRSGQFFNPNYTFDNQIRRVGRLHDGPILDSMRRLLSTRTLASVGAIALASALLWSILGLVFYDTAMIPNLLAELAGTSAEVCIAILVIERIASTYRKRQWSYAYKALSDRAAMIFVDVMRLLSVRSSESGLEINGNRYEEFYELAGLHLAEYRSNIEGFAGLLEPDSHEALRRVDRWLSWAISKLGNKPTTATGRLEFADLMRETAITLERFLKDNGGPSYLSERDAVEAALQAARKESQNERVAGRRDILALRMSAQNKLLQNPGSPHPKPQGIWYDANNDLAVGYFLIDHHILLQDRLSR